MNQTLIFIIVLISSLAVNLLLLKLLIFKGQRAEELLRIYTSLHGDLELNNVIKILTSEIKRLGADVHGFYKANPKTGQFEAENNDCIPIVERGSLSKAFFHLKPQRLLSYNSQDCEIMKRIGEQTLYVIPVQMQAERSCWEANSCSDKLCRCHSRFKRPCWRESGLRHRGTNLESHEEKALHCLNCKSFIPVGFFIVKTRRPSRIFNFIDNNFRGLLKDSVMYERAFISSTRDYMTGVYNKMSFLKKLTEHLQLSDRYSHHLSLAMLDVDHFKKFNDTYGHQTGDFILKEMTALISTLVRETDIVARYGGEEFAIIYPETDKNAALLASEKIRKTIESHHFISPDHKNLRITISMGIASAPEDDIENIEGIISKADIALYHSKTNRNNCALYNRNFPSMPKNK